MDSIDGLLQQLPTEWPNAIPSDNAVWLAYQDICDGMPKFQALILNNLTEEYYNENVDRIVNQHLQA